MAMAVFSLLGGCAVGPTYHRPDAAPAVDYKEARGWIPAAPADTLERGPWWTLFGDPILNELVASVQVSNQNVIASAAAYAQARALVAQDRAAMFPSVTLDGGGTRAATKSSGTSNTYTASLGATWEPDVWGRLGRTTDNASLTAQATAGDLAAATLSAQGELATDYIALRQTDAQKTMLEETIKGYQRSLAITQARYQAGLVAKTDVLTAQTLLTTANSDALTLDRSRAQYEHAIAVLVGKAPSEFSLPPAPWTAVVPEVPVGVPSVLLQRRPDIAAAERRMAAANEAIGIAQAGYYPSLSLSGAYGGSSSVLGDLFKASSNVWSLGLSATQTLFDAGATRAKVASAQAAYDQTVASYRQTVLTAFQAVEDDLTATRILEKQQELQRQATDSANQAEAQLLNRYRAGQVVYSDVVTAQVTALTARRALVQVQADRQTAAVALIQALGGGWRGLQQ